MEESYAYESLAQDLENAGVVPSLAELHGGLCGVMCIGGVGAADRWLGQYLEEWQQSPEGDVGEALRNVELSAWRSLSGTEMSFEPLLPSEEQPLEMQVRALALWCHGFLSGLAFGGLGERTHAADADEAVAEITQDFAEISRAALGPEDEHDLAQAGFALAELKEYVRVSVQLLFEHFGGRQLEPGSDTIH